MKKLLSLFITIIMIFTLALPAYAASKVNFEVRVTAETDTQAEIMFSYKGGKTFNALDVEFKLSDRLTVSSAVKSTGLKAFEEFVTEKEGLVASAIGSTNNPIKSSFASTISFQNVSGNDMYRINVKKSSSDKITADDVTVTVTNCGTLSGNNVKELDASVSNLIGKGEDKTEKNASKTENKSVQETSSTESTSSTQSTESELTFQDEFASVTEVQNVQENTETAVQTKSAIDRNKIITIIVAAVCCIMVIVAVCIYMAKKAKNDEEN